MAMKPALKCLAALCLLTTGLGVHVLSATPAAAATTWFVDAGGSDANDCASLATACATVSHALVAAVDGDTIEVSGTIFDHVTVDESVTITGANAPQASPAIIDGSDTDRVFNQNGNTVTYDHLTIQNGNSQFGSGIITDGNTIITNSVIKDNFAETEGGGIAAVHGTLSITDSTLSFNTAGGTNALGFGGGAVWTQDATVTIARSTLMHNQADFTTGPNNDGDGGALSSYNGLITVTDSTFKNNSAGRGGAGMGPGMTFINTTFSGNQAGHGAALYPTGVTTIIGSTFAGNTAFPLGGAIITQVADITIGGTILGPNTPNNCHEIAGTTSWTSLGYNIVSDDSCPALADSTDQHEVDPLLGALQDNGGPTETMAPGALSPAIDNIPNPTTDMCPRADQRGEPSLGDCDTGAYETVPPRTPQTITFNAVPDSAVGSDVDASSYASSDSGLSLTFTSTTTSVCTVLGSTVSLLTVGTCTIKASQAGDETYEPADDVSESFNVLNLPEAPLIITSTSGTVGTPLTLTTAGGSGSGAVTFEAVPGTASGCTLAGSGPYTLSVTTAGTCLVTPSKASDGSYLAQTGGQTTITFTAPAPSCFTLTTATNGTGSGTVGATPSPDCEGDSTKYTSGTSVSISATADTGSTFGGFSGAGCGATTPCSVSMTADRSVTATFTLSCYTLTTATTGTGTGTVGASPAPDCPTDSAKYAHGTSVSVTATADPGSTFGGFSGAGCGASTPCSVSMTADRSVTATFTATPPPVSTEVLCFKPSTDVRVPYKTGLCPAGYRAETIETVEVGGLVACRAFGTDLRAPYREGNCPSEMKTVRLATTGPTDGVFSCWKPATDVRAPYPVDNPWDAVCPSGYALMFLKEHAPA